MDLTFMIPIYKNLVKNNVRTLDSVPESIREQVKNELEKEKIDTLNN